MSDVLALLAVRNRQPVIMVEDVSRLTSAWNLEGLDIEHARGRVLTSAELLLGSRVNSDSCDEVWTTAAGDRIRIGDMAHSHLVHALAMLVRKAREGKVWYARTDGALRYVPRHMTDLDDVLRAHKGEL